MNAINYGGLMFTNPVPLAYALAPHDSGLFAVQVRCLACAPLPFQPIAFGAAANLAAAPLDRHPEFGRWKMHRLAADGLFVSFCTLRYASASYRESALADLTARYLTRWSEAPRAIATAEAADEGPAT